MLVILFACIPVFLKVQPSVMMESVVSECFTMEAETSHASRKKAAEVPGRVDFPDDHSHD